MTSNHIGIEAIDYIEPDVLVSSDEIEDRLSEVYDKLKLPFGRIEMQTGIKTRGVYNDKKPSDIATLAAKRLFESNNINPSDIDLLIYTGVCRDFLEPSTASVVHSHLKLSVKCMSFDLSNACLGFVNGMILAKNLIESGSLKKVLVVTGENSKPLLDHTIKTISNDSTLTRKSIKKYFANFSIGSAGVAAVISCENLLASFTQSKSLSDTAAHTLCQGSGNLESLVMETESEELMQRGIALARQNWLDFLLAEKLTANNYAHFICHQVGVHHRDFLYKNLELDLAKDHTTFDIYGNTGSAALPLTLYKCIKSGKMKAGDQFAFLGIGSGLHTLMVGAKWL